MAVNAVAHHQVGRGAHVYHWSIQDADSGDPVSVPVAADRIVHMFGTWNGNTITMQGSNEPGIPTSWVSLEDILFTGTAALLADGTVQIGSNSVWIRPLDNGTGTTQDVDVYLLVRNG